MPVSGNRPARTRKMYCRHPGNALLASKNTLSAIAGVLLEDKDGVRLVFGPSVKCLPCQAMPPDPVFGAETVHTEVRLSLGNVRDTRNRSSQNPFCGQNPCR